jgi:hypothetical protein
MLAAAKLMLMLFSLALQLHVFFSVLTFGFDPVVYSVSESGSVDLGVFFISGNAGQFVPHVNASTVDGTATGKYC